jgi:hypothetical protein
MLLAAEITARLAADAAEEAARIAGDEHVARQHRRMKHQLKLLHQTSLYKQTSTLKYLVHTAAEGVIAANLAHRDRLTVFQM